MRIYINHRHVIAILLVITAVAVYLLAAGRFSQQGPDNIDIAIVEDLLRRSEATSSYRLIPDSVMTGLCWHADDGSREGVFKDVNAGMAHWRDHAPVKSSSAAFAGADSSTKPETYSDHLRQQLDSLSFTATDFSYSEQLAEITGILTIAGRDRQVVLAVNMPAASPLSGQRDLIELHASTVISLQGINNSSAAPAPSPVKLCLTMQAARESMLPAPYSAQPLMLSHYY